MRAESPMASRWFSSFEKPDMRFIQFRSAPAENDLPAPESTTMRTESSPSISRKDWVSSAMSASSNALWRSGRLRVMRPTGPWCSMAREVMSHAEDAEVRRLLGRVARHREREAEDAARVRRVDDAIVPEARGGVIGVALALVLLADRRLELLLLVLRPGALLRLDAVAPHGGEHAGGLLAAH